VDIKGLGDLMSKIKAFCLVLASLLSWHLDEPAFAAQAPAFATVDSWRKLTAEVKDDLRLTWRTALIAKKQAVVSRGRYAVGSTMTLEGRTFALIPARFHDQQTDSDVETDVLSDALVGAPCHWEIRYFVPVDLESGSVRPQAVALVSRPGCGFPPRTPIEVQHPGRLMPSSVHVVFTSHATPEEFDAAKRVRDAAMNEHQAAAESSEQAGLELTRAANNQKREIGTKLCKRAGRTTFIGYTERVSPDNGKIQIRVAAQVLTSAPSLSAGGFEGSIIWDDPTGWDLCN